MSRTWRNRHAVPKGYKVRDGSNDVVYDSDGEECYTDSHAHTVVHWRHPVVFYSYWGFSIISPNILENWKIETFQGRRKIPIVHRYVKKFRKSIYSKENKSHRKMDRGRMRAKVRDQLKTGRWDDIPNKETKSCGWNTW